MNSKSASWVIGLALGAAPFAATAGPQMGPPGMQAAPPAAKAEGNPGELSETQWLRQRVEQLQAALARGDNCAVKPGPSHKTGAAGVKSSHKAGKSGDMGSMDMESGHGMKAKKPMDKMDDPMQAPSDPPAAMPMEKEGNK